MGLINLLGYLASVLIVLWALWRRLDDHSDRYIEEMIERAIREGAIMSYHHRHILQAPRHLPTSPSCKPPLNTGQLRRSYSNRIERIEEWPLHTNPCQLTHVTYKIKLGGGYTPVHHNSNLPAFENPPLPPPPKDGMGENQGA